MSLLCNTSGYKNAEPQIIYTKYKKMYTLKFVYRVRQNEKWVFRQIYDLIEGTTTKILGLIDYFIIF